MPAWTLLLLATLAWGTFAFGAVYPWGYWPLFVACGALGLVGTIARRGDAEPPPPRRQLWLATAAVGAAVAIQLVPLPSAAVRAMSPATAAFPAPSDLAHTVATSAVGMPPASAAADATLLRGWRPPSIKPEATRRALVGFAALSALWLGSARMLSMTGARGIARGLVALGLLLALAGIIQKATLVEKIYGVWEPQDGRGFHIFGPYVNRNHFAGGMLMFLSVALGYLGALIARGMRGVRPGWRDRILWFSSPAANELILVAFGAIVMGLSLVMTLSRSGVASFALALVIVGYFLMRRQPTRSRRAVAVSYLGLLLVVVITWAGTEQLVERFTGTSGSPLAGRLQAWTAALRIASDFPLTGTGLNTYGTAMLMYQSSGSGAYWREAHNDYVQLVAEGGLLLGLPVLIALILFVREVARRFREDTRDETAYWLRIGAVTGLIAVGIQEAVDFSLQILGNAALFAVLAAIASHQPRGRVERET